MPGIVHTKKLIQDLEMTIIDAKHHSIFSLLSDFTSISHEIHEILPEIEDLTADELMELSVPVYSLIKSLISIMVTT